MGKVHLTNFVGFTMCNMYGNATTKKWSEVTCKNCMKTNEYKRIKAKQLKKEAKEIMASHGRDDTRWNKKHDMSCHNCGWCVNNKCTHKNPDVVLYLEDGTRCCQYTKEPQHTFTAKPSDPAIDLLNEVAELIKISELDTGEKLKVIDFIESRVRQGKL